MSKNKSIKKNYIYNLMYQVLAMIVPLITTPYLSRVLGPERIGIYGYTLSITTYFILFGSLGVAMYGEREIAYNQNDINKRSRVFFEIFIMKAITILISMVIFFLTFCTHGQYSTYYRILLLEVLANMIDISWFLQGIEGFKKTVVRNSLVKIVSLICIFTFIKSKEDLMLYFMIYVLSTFLGNLSFFLYLPKFVTKVPIKELKPFNHLKPTISLFIPQIAIQLYTVLDKTMIGTIIPDKSEVGYYEQAQKIVKLLLTIATSLGTVMVPRMASTFAEGNKEKIKEYLNNSFRFVMMIVFPLMFGIISVAEKFVPIYYGPGYDKVTYLICIISPILVAIGLSNVIGTQFFIPTKRQKEFTISVTCGAIVNFILNLILIYKYQSIGASIATVIAEMTVTGVQFYLARKDISFIDVIKSIRNYFFASILMFIVSILIGKLISNEMISIIVQVITSGIVYFGLLLTLKDQLIKVGIEIIRNRFMIRKS